jgi:hypothetical protein
MEGWQPQSQLGDGKDPKAAQPSPNPLDLRLPHTTYHSVISLIFSCFALQIGTIMVSYLYIILWEGA